MDKPQTLTVDAALRAHDVDGKELQPWPHPVNGEDLLDELVALIEAHVALPNDAAVAVAIWIVHTWLPGAKFHTPRLTLLSPIRGCGKSTLLDLVGLLVAHPESTSNISTAAFFRGISQRPQTLLIDEADRFLTDKEDLIGAVNAGFAQNGAITRCVGDHHQPHRFRCFAPVALAAIGNLPTTIEDRSIVISLQKRPIGQALKRLRRDQPYSFNDRRRQIASWANDNFDWVKSHDPSIPTEIANDRAKDCARPLLAIADAVGGRWCGIGRRALTDLYARREGLVEEDLALMLLRDVRGIFDEMQTDKISSETIVCKLLQLSDAPWSESHRGKPISKHQLAKLLKPFGIKSKSLRHGATTSKGYDREDFEEAFQAYLPPPP